MVEAILYRAVVEQQAYRSCLGVLSLREKLGPLRLERPAASSFHELRLHPYQQLKNILEKNMDISPTPQEGVKKTPGHGFRRGAEYFGGGDHA